MKEISYCFDRDGMCEGENENRLLATIRAYVDERVAELQGDRTHLLELVKVLREEIANLKAQQAERVKEAERQARLDEARKWNDWHYRDDDIYWNQHRIAELKAKR